MYNSNAISVQPGSKAKYKLLLSPVILITVNAMEVLINA
jgi:hypothetical protein